MTTPDLPSREEMLKLADGLDDGRVGTWRNAGAEMLRQIAEALASRDAKAGGLREQVAREVDPSAWSTKAFFDSRPDLIMGKDIKFAVNYSLHRADAILSLDLLAAARADSVEVSEAKLQAACEAFHAEVATTSGCSPDDLSAEGDFVNWLPYDGFNLRSAMRAAIRALPIADPSPPPAEPERHVYRDGGQRTPPHTLTPVPGKPGTYRMTPSAPPAEDVEGAVLAALREAERFMAYFAGETDGYFEGSGSPKSCLAQIRAALNKDEVCQHKSQNVSVGPDGRTPIYTCTKCGARTAPAKEER